MFFSPLFAEEVPGGRAAPESITMPWNQFSELWEKYREPVSERSKPFAYESARYKGRAVVEKSNYYLKFEALIQVAAFSDHNILVPVISKSLSPEEMSINNKSAGWIEKNGYYHVMIGAKGKHDILARFTITLDAMRWPRSFQLPLVPIPKSEVQLDVADSDIEARFEPGVVVETIRNQEGDHLRGIVPAVQNVAIRWLKRGEKRERIPLKMGAVVHSYISLGENGANVKSDIAFQVLQGETHYFQIRVPKTIDILDVTSTDGKEKISQWYAQDDEDGRIIHIYASYRHKAEFSVRLDCERTETRTNYGFSVPHITPQTVERYENLIAVGSEANVEIAETAVEHAEGRDVRFVPEVIQQVAKGRSLFYYKVLEEDFNLAFEVKSHDKAAVVKTRIERLEADSVVTEVGTVMTKATFHVKNNQAQFLRLLLPRESKLLSAFTNGREIQPVMDDETLLIPVDKSTEASFLVEIAWLSKIGRFGIVGKNSVFLPLSDVSIGELSWRLYTPERYQMFYFSGNVRYKSPGIIPSLGGMLFGMLDGNVRSAYAGGGRSSKSYEYNVESLRTRFKKGKQFEKSAFDAGLRSAQVQVQIPVTGNLYRFSSYLIKEFTPKITFYYINEAIHHSIAFIYGGCAFVFSFWFLGFVFKRSELDHQLLERRCWLPAVIIGTVLTGIMMVLKLGIFSSLFEGTILGVIVFAFWQNRQEAKSFHKKVSGWRSRLPELFLFLLGAAIAVSLMAGAWGFAAVISVASILFHGAFFKLLEFVDHLRKKKRETVTVALFFLSLIVLIPRTTCAGASAQIEQQHTPIATTKSEARVRLSWPTVEHMLKAIEEREESQRKLPDAEYLFGTVDIDGEITEHYASLRIDVPLTLVTEKYARIPLVSTTTPVAEAFYNGEPIALQRDKKYIYFEAGRDDAREGLLRMQLTAPVREQGGVKEFSVSSPLLQGGNVELRFGTDIKSVKLYNVSWEKREGRVIRAALGTSQKLRGELATFIRKQEDADEGDKRVKKRYATTYTLVSFEDEIATYYSSIRYRILNEHVREFTIRLPEHVVVHEIVGEDMEGWRVGITESNMTTYHIKVMYPVANRYDLSVRYETAIPEVRKTFVIPCLLVEGVARDTGYLGIEMRGRGEISVDTLEKARLIDIRELPDIIRTDAQAPFVYAFRYIERPYRIGFNIRTHKGLQMDPAIADRIEYTRVISPQGKVLSQAQIWIRNSRKQYVTFHLPKGARIISNFLDGKSMKPSIDERGTLLLPLKRQSAVPFVLDVVFEEPDISIFNIGGRMHLSYPRVDIPVSTVSSNIYVPKQMKVFEPEGNFQKTELINYVQWASEESINDRRQVQQRMLSGNTMPRQVAGTRSLRINIPKHGKKISTNAFYVPAGDTLESRFIMVHQYIYYFGYGLAFILFVAIGSLLTRSYRSALFWGLSLPPIVILYYLFGLTWKIIVFAIVIGSALSHIVLWLKGKTSVQQEKSK